MSNPTSFWVYIGPAGLARDHRDNCSHGVAATNNHERGGRRSLTMLQHEPTRKACVTKVGASSRRLPPLQTGIALMSDTMETEITLRIRLDQPVSDKALADELALHIAPLIARHIACGDVVIGDVEGTWVLHRR